MTDPVGVALPGDGAPGRGGRTALLAAALIIAAYAVLAWGYYLPASRTQQQLRQLFMNNDFAGVAELGDRYFRGCRHLPGSDEVAPLYLAALCRTGRRADAVRAAELFAAAYGDRHGLYGSYLAGAASAGSP